ncbi:MAG: uroporphyrinogen-III synthase [Deltaproteobacteria bacterium]|nr:uroporphyrinogen-III synthase [Deltaproteobacteria bacterium]
MTLQGKRILLGRHQTDSSPLEERLRQQGAVVRCVPLIKVQRVDPIDTSQLNRQPDVVVITSKNAIDGYETLRPLLAPHQLAVVGLRTARECEKRGFVPDVVGSGKGALSLLQQLARHSDLSGKHMLYPCSNLVGDGFDEAAAALGATVQMVTVYRTAPPEDLDVAHISDFDSAVFYSSSGARHFHSLKPFAKGQRPGAVAMGEQTAATLRELGADKVCVATRPDVDALFDAVVKSVAED